MSDLLKITKTEGKVTILHFEGRLDGQTETLAIAEAQNVKKAGARHLLIDLSGLDMVTSAGLRALHNIYKLFTPREEAEAWHKTHADDVYKSPYFKLAGAPPNIYYILNIAGFLQNIQIYPDMKDALASFGF